MDDEQKYQQYCDEVDGFYAQLDGDELSDEEIELIEQASAERLSRYGYSEQAK